MLFIFLSTLVSFNSNLLPDLFSSLPPSSSISEVNYDYEPTKTLIADLQKGGYVIFFRHTATDMKQKDRDPNLENCDGQRNLNQKGKEEAQQIGAAFRRFNIPVGKVLSSPFCRTLETAQIAFGKATKSEALLSVFYDHNKNLTIIQSFTKLLRTMPSDATNTILVGHGVNLDTALEITLKEGGAAIFKPKPDSSFALVSQIQEVKEWEELTSK
jgi:phosphohistidine phosphatase SixA